MLLAPFGAGVAPRLLPLSGLGSPTGPGFVVAIPVKDEEERLPACLRALALQRDRLGLLIPPTLIRVAIFANNCADQSATSLESWAELIARRLRG